VWLHFSLEFAMANRSQREARRKKREKIRLGPSDTARAWLKLLGVEITPWAPGDQNNFRTGVDHFAVDHSIQPTPPSPGEWMLRIRMNMRAWHAQVIDARHVSKMLYCTCDEQWISEAKSLRAAADKWKKEHPNQMVFLHGARTGRWSANAAALAAGYGAGPHTFRRSGKSDIYKHLARYAERDTDAMKKLWLGADFAKTELRVASHIHDTTIYETVPKE
jgi:hypothetical protein